jgi:enoyl-CoA hydratase/carnithine racemase
MIDASLVTSDRRPLAAGGVARVLTLNRPDQLNPLDWDTLRAFVVALDVVEADEDLRVGFVTGAGRAFSPGEGLRAFAEKRRPLFRGN